MKTFDSTTDQQASAVSSLAVPPAPSVSEATNDTLPSTAPMATVVVPANANLRDHDLLIVKWEGNDGDGTVITFPLPIASGAAGMPYPHVIQAPAIVANAESTVRVSYEILRDGVRPGELSVALELHVGGDAIALPAPTVDYVVAGILDPADAPAGTNVRIETYYAGAVKGDSIFVSWNGKDSASSYSNTFAVAPGTEIVFPIPVQYITDNQNAEVSATYQVMRANGTSLYGTRLSFQIGSVITTLPRPAIVEVVGGILDGQLATAAIPAAANLKVSDVVTLRWTTQRGSISQITHVVTGAEEGKDLFLLVPESTILKSRAWLVAVDYDISRTGESNIRSSDRFVFRVRGAQTYVENFQDVPDGTVTDFLRTENWVLSTAEPSVSIGALDRGRGIRLSGGVYVIHPLRPCEKHSIVCTTSYTNHFARCVSHPYGSQDQLAHAVLYEKAVAFSVSDPDEFITYVQHGPNSGGPSHTGQFKSMSFTWFDEDAPPMPMHPIEETFEDGHSAGRNSSLIPLGFSVGSETSHPPYITGSYLEGNSETCEILLIDPCRSIRLGYYFNSPASSCEIFTTTSTEGVTVSLNSLGWLEFTSTPGQGLIDRIVFNTPGRYLMKLDNITLTYDEPWVITRTPG